MTLFKKCQNLRCQKYFQAEVCTRQRNVNLQLVKEVNPGDVKKRKRRNKVILIHNVYACRNSKEATIKLLELINELGNITHIMSIYKNELFLYTGIKQL